MIRTVPDRSHWWSCGTPSRRPPFRVLYHGGGGLHAPSPAIRAARDIVGEDVMRESAGGRGGAQPDGGPARPGGRGVGARGRGAGRVVAALGRGADRVFGLTAAGTTPGREVVAGVTTFLAMAYILFVNPQVLGETGMDVNAVFVATAVASALGTLVMGLWARYPVA